MCILPLGLRQLRTQPPRCSESASTFPRSIPLKRYSGTLLINGFVAVPMRVAMMWVGTRRNQMGRFTVHPITLAPGRVTTAIMALVAFAEVSYSLSFENILAPSLIAFSGERRRAGWRFS
jgi:hypothetical protein